MAPKKTKMESTLKSKAEDNALTVKWGAFDVPGLDPKRAEAIGLTPAVKKIGYGSASQEMAPMLQQEGTIARYCRRTLFTKASVAGTGIEKREEYIAPRSNEVFGQAGAPWAWLWSRLTRFAARSAHFATEK